MPGGNDSLAAIIFKVGAFLQRTLHHKQHININIFYIDLDSQVFHLKREALGVWGLKDAILEIFAALVV